jgi:hypothetical protein
LGFDIRSCLKGVYITSIILQDIRKTTPLPAKEPLLPPDQNAPPMLPTTYRKKIQPDKNPAKVNTMEGIRFQQSSQAMTGVPYIPIPGTQTMKKQDIAP